MSSFDVENPDKNFLLTKEDEKFRKYVRNFVLNEIAPVADKIEDEDEFSYIREIYRKLGKNN
ncbi:MAG: acyl-CoA dehydrogenase family protein, partial [Promethearchaeota archaeon]